MADQPPAFVCLHGIGGSPGEWSQVSAVLQSSGTVICPRVPKGSLSEARDALLAQVRSLERRVVLIGHSRGGVLALMLAAESPDVAEAVVLSGGYVPPTRADRSWVVGVGSWVKHRSRLAAGFVRHGHLSAGYPELERAPAESIAAVLEMARTGLRPAAYDALARSVRCPVLAIAGSRDSHVPTSWVLAAARRYRWDTVVLSGAGHFAHVEVAAAWSDALMGWLRDDDR